MGAGVTSGFDMAELERAIRVSVAMRKLFDEALEHCKQNRLGPYFACMRAIHDLNAPAVAAKQYDPYIVDWTRLFTPIEEDAWYSIRSLGLTMFPQFPVDRYFVDFGDPWQRVAFECDGRQFHDEARDRERDEALAACGWRVLHIPGWQLVRIDDDKASGHNVIRSFLGMPALVAEDDGR